MLHTAVYALPMMIIWLILANQPPTPSNLIMGYIFGFAIMLLIRVNSSYEDDERPLTLKHIPRQVWAIIIYTARLGWDILFSGIDVARRIIPPEMQIKPGIILISTCDTEKNSLVAALSAHAITITPGSLVIDFDDDYRPTQMYVHVLDTDMYSHEKLTSDQEQRIHSIRRMLSGVEQ